MRSIPTILALGALLLPAQAAVGAPAGFFGASYDGDVRDAEADVQAAAWRKMRGNGVRAARTVFSWARAQPQEGAAFDFSGTDQFVEHAARYRVQLLPIVMNTPGWAREHPQHWWPRNPGRQLRPYLTALVERYGPRGSFWDENPDVPRRPLRHWQIYNEPGRTERYGPVLRAAYRGIKSSDRRAKVVLAGLTGVAHGTPWDILDYQYREGKIKRYFDVAALNIYTGKPRNVFKAARLFRKVMAKHGNRRKPLWLTEFGITASKGRTEAPRSQRTLRTTDRGMARFLSKSYRLLARRGRRIGVRRAYWYTWSSSYEPGSNIFRFTGLTQYSDGRFRAKPALRVYRRLARG